MDPMVSLSNAPIPTAVYQTLRVESGLSAKSAEAAQIGLANTLHFTSVHDKAGHIIGMGRVIGDGGTFCQVVDICVLPPWQGQGIGRLIMADILNFIEKKLPPTCYISLIADGNADQLYAKFGFKDTLPNSKGMYFRR